MQLASQPPQFRGARGARSSRSIAPPRACCSTSGRDSFAAAASGGRRGDTRVRATNGEDSDFDISVFQFTLGIPGIPDEQVPRILGLVTGSLLLLNHILSDTVEAAQSRSEAIGLVLAGTCIALPALNERINFSNSSILSQSQRTVPDTKEVFYLEEDGEESALKELAWNSFALLKNTNSSFTLFAKGGTLMLARGSFKIPGLPAGIPVTDNYPISKVLSKSFENTGSFDALQNVLAERGESSVYLESQSMIERLRLYEDLCFLAKGIQSVVIAKSGDDGVVIVGANTPRAFSSVQQKWIANIGKKLAAS